MSQRQISSWAGIIGATIFVLTFTLEGCCRPDYKPLEMLVSELSLGSRGWIQISNFIIFSILLFVFTRGIAAEFPNGKAIRWGSIILTFIAICYLLLGLFVMDPLNTPREQMTFHGTIHFIVGMIMFTLMPISCFVFLCCFSDDRKWRSLRRWTFGLGIISALGLVLFIMAAKMPEMQKLVHNQLGLIQRIAMVPFMVWIFIFALGLMRQSKKS